MNKNLHILRQINRDRLDGQYQAAIDKCKKILTKDENDVEVMALLSVLYHQLAFSKTERFSEFTDKAIFWITQSIEEEPDRADFHAIRGRIYVDAPNYEEAARNFRLALQLNPYLLSACFGLSFLARAAQETVDLDESIAVMKKAVEVHLTNLLVFDDLHGLLTLKGETDEANEALKKVFLCVEPLPEKYH